PPEPRIPTHLPTSLTDSVTSMLDPLDREILRLVQENNRLSHAAIGKTVGLSDSSVRRRLHALREKGVIEADVSILAPETVGIQAIVTVSFETESVEGDDAFRQRMLETPEVSQCYAVSGEVDYILVVHVPDLPSYEAWGKRVLMADPAIRRYGTHLVWNRVKFSTAIPLPG
ncbi:MAG: Lrp/AsnC family transcriptional regulator, partial [Bacteroidota bacterium]